MKMSTFSSFFSIFYSLAHKIRQIMQRDVRKRTHTPATHTHTQWTALHIQSAGEVNEEARSAEQHGLRGCDARCLSHI